MLVHKLESFFSFRKSRIHIMATFNCQMWLDLHISGSGWRLRTFAIKCVFASVPAKEDLIKKSRKTRTGIEFVSSGTIELT